MTTVHVDQRAYINGVSPLIDSRPVREEYGNRLHIGVMDVHNTTGDLIDDFEGNDFAELSVNPAKDVTIFSLP